MGHDEAAADLLWIRSILISADFVEIVKKKKGIGCAMLQTVFTEPRANLSTTTVDWWWTYVTISRQWCIMSKDFQTQTKMLCFCCPQISAHHNVLTALCTGWKARCSQCCFMVFCGFAGLIRKRWIGVLHILLEKQLRQCHLCLASFTEERYRLLVHDSLVPKIERLRQEHSCNRSRAGNSRRVTHPCFWSIWRKGWTVGIIQRWSCTVFDYWEKKFEKPKEVKKS